MHAKESKVLHTFSTALAAGMLGALLVVYLLRRDLPAVSTRLVAITNSIAAATNVVPPERASKADPPTKGSVGAVAPASETPLPAVRVKTKGGGNVEPDPAPDTSEAHGKGTRQLASLTVPKPDPVLPVARLPYHEVFVLSVGINLYPGMGNLDYALNDAAEVSGLFQQKFGFKNVTLLTNTNATRGNITRELESIRGRLSGTNDDVIFFFSGHGCTKVSTEIAQGHTNTHRHGFLVPYEPTLRNSSSLDEFRAYALEMKWIVEQMLGIRARHRLLFIDSCFSGFAFAEQSARRKVPDDFYREIIRQPTVQIMTAGLDSEESLEFAELRHGAFTHALLRQLQQPGMRTMEEVFLPLRADLREELTRLNSPKFMTPQHRYLKYEDGTFVFVPTDRLDQWADARPATQEYERARTRGYFDPVQPAELAAVTNAVQSASQSNREWQDRVERYEYRASLGDPYAQAALARMYQYGLGTKPDPQRARLWGLEGQETMADVFGIKDPLAAAVVNAAIYQAMVGNNRNMGNMMAMGAMMAAFSGAFGGDPGQGMENRRLEIVKLVNEKNYKEASHKLRDYDKQLNELVSKFSPAPPPAELDDIRASIKAADDRIGLNIPKAAIIHLDHAGQRISELRERLKEKNAKP